MTSPSVSQPTHYKHGHCPGEEKAAFMSFGECVLPSVSSGALGLVLAGVERALAVRPRTPQQPTVQVFPEGVDCSRGIETSSV